MSKLSPASIISALTAIITLLAFMIGTSTAQTVRLKPLFSITGADMEKPFNQPSDVFIDDRHHEIYVVDAGNRRIVIYDTDGSYKYRFTVPGTGSPNGIAVDHRGEILITIDGQVAVCDFRGSLLQYVDFQGFTHAEKVKATRLEVDKENNYYVLDAAQRRVLAFDSEWDFRFAIDNDSFPRTVRKLTHGEAQQQSPARSLSIADICVDDEGTIYLVDPMASYVFAFDKEGKYIRSIGQPGAAFNTLSLPFGVAVDSAKRVLVVDSTGHGLLGYDKEGMLLFAYGGLGKTEGRLYFPKYVSTDADGRIYVVEPFLGRIQILIAEQQPAQSSSP